MENSCETVFYTTAECSLMKYQKKPWSCGSAVVVNTARCFGVKVSEYKVWGLAGTTQESGTQEDGIIHALRELGFSVTEYSSSDKVVAWSWLMFQLGEGHVVVLCSEAWEHWILVCGRLGTDKVVVVDSANFKVNKKENGVHILTKRQIMRRWWNARKSIEGEPRLYGISVYKYK